MTIIDSLVVKLGFDNSGMKSKVPEVTKDLKAVEVQGERTAKSVESLGAAAGKFLAIIGGTVAIKAFISDFISANAQLDRFSKNLGLSVETISAWSQATEQLGGSASGLQGTLDMLSKSQTELRLTGESGLIPYLSALGVSLAGVDGKARPVDDLLLDLADRFAGMDRTTANNMGRMMGIDQGTMNLLLQGRRELELTIKRQKESTTVTKQQAAEATKLQTTIAQTRQRFIALGNSLVISAAPAIEKVLDLFLRLGNWVLENREVVSDFLKVMAVGLAAIALAASPITLTTAAIVALAAGVALLWQDYQTWKRGGDSLIDWGKWEPGITAATNGIHALWEVLRNTIPLLREFMQWGRAKLGGDSSPVNQFSDKVRNRIRGFMGLDKNTESVSDQAKAQAQRVSGKTGIPADIIWAAWKHETGNFSNRGARELNNLAGVNVPGGNGTDYRKFKSLDEFGDYYAYLMRPNGNFPNAAAARTPDAFADALKHGRGGMQYYTGPESVYAARMRENASLFGVPGAGGAAAGASSSAPSTDNRQSVHVDTINVNTPATDAQGIAQDIGQSMNYLFPAQANGGLK